MKIWLDPCLPRGFSRKPITPRRSSLLTYVDDLINPITGNWDEELIKHTFWENDAVVILPLPVFEGREKTLAWHYDKRGMFSVQGAYKMCHDDISFGARVTRGGAQGEHDAYRSSVGSNLEPKLSK